MWLPLLLTALAHAGSWPGTGGKICFDTPKPVKNSGQDLRETYGSGLQGEFYHVDMQVDPPPRSCPWEAR